jgi:hypothetical protein
MRDIFKLRKNEMIDYNANPLKIGSNGEEIQGGLPYFKNSFYVPIKTKDTLKTK